MFTLCKVHLWHLRNCIDVKCLCNQHALENNEEGTLLINTDHTSTIALQKSNSEDIFSSIKKTSLGLKIETAKERNDTLLQIMFK